MNLIRYCLFLCIFYLFSCHEARNICTDPVIMGNGEPSLQLTTLSCLYNISDARMPPSYSKQLPSVVVEANLVFNNIIEINELEGTATLDFKFRLYWTDERIYMPDLWPLMDPYLVGQGYDITPMVRDGDDPLPLWFPDIHFSDSVAFEVYAESIRVRPDTMYWSRHVLVTLAQPNFIYQDYPNDCQDVDIRFESYALPTQFLTLHFHEPAVDFYENGKDYNIKANPTWKYDSYTTTKTSPDYSLNPNVTRIFDQLSVELNMCRRSSGLINRLILPIVLLLILGGATFWIALEKRSDNVMTLLLSVSALYIVVFGNIPMLGYLTTMDYFVLHMLILLVCLAAMHLVSEKLLSKEDKYPLRAYFVRIFEFFGRAVVLPFVLIYYVVAFNSSISYTDMIIVFLLIAVSAYMVMYREFHGVRKEFSVAMDSVRNKLDKPLQYSCTALELFLFNLYSYRILSTSKAAYNRQSAAAKHGLRTAKAQMREFEEERRSTNGEFNSASATENAILKGSPTRQGRVRGSADIHEL